MNRKIILLLMPFFVFGLFFAKLEKSQASTMDECYHTYELCYNSYDDESALTECENNLQSCESTASDNTGNYYDTQTNQDVPVQTDANGYTQATCVAPYQWIDNQCTDVQTLPEGQGYTRDECDKENGYWANNTCYTDKNSFCEDTMGPNYTWSTLRQKCTGDKGADCSSNSDCAVGLNCTNNVCGGSDQATAAQKQTANQAATAKTSADASLQNAKNAVNAANAQLASCGDPAGAACQAAQQAANKANADLIAANAKAEQANEDYLKAMDAINGGSSNSGLQMTANGVLGPVYDQGQTYGGGGNFSVGIGGGGYSGGVYSGGASSGLPGNYSTSVAGLSGAGKCGNGFKEIGGVCFPQNTGLSESPIYVILSNLFSWLMGLFTTFAVGAFVFSGIQYLTSAGNEKQAEKGKQNAMYSIIGIIAGLSGFLIVKAIAAALSGSSYFF